jgi:hypothetical protein
MRRSVVAAKWASFGGVMAAIIGKAVADEAVSIGVSLNRAEGR